MGQHELDLPDDSLPRFSLTERGVVWLGSSADAALSWQGTGGEPVELTTDPPLFFTADPLGDLVVWVTSEHQMVTYDVTEQRVIDQRSVLGMLTRDEVNPIGTFLPVLYVDDQRVVFEGSDDVWTLDLTAGTTRRLPDVSASDLLDYDPAVSVVAVTDLRDRGAGGPGGPRSLAQLEFRTATGSVRAETGRLFQEGRLSPDGRWFVTSTGYEAGLRTVVLDTSTGKPVPLDLPEEFRGPYPDPWGWSGTDVLMVGVLDRTDAEDSEDPWTCRPALESCDLLPASADNVYPW